MSRLLRSVVGVRRLAVLAACLVVVLSGATSISRASTAVSGTSLPFTSGSSWLAVDPVNHHVFVSGGAGNTSVVVLDFDGNIVKTITGESGASGLAINTATHTLYVALHDVGQLALIDTNTLTETSRVSTGSDTDPFELAIAGGKLWITGDDTMTANLDGTGLTKSTTWGSLLIAASRDGNLLAGANSGYSPASASVVDVATATPTPVSSAWNPGGDASNGQDISFDASGQNVLFASGAPYYVQSLGTQNLMHNGQYTTGAYPSDVAVSPNGGYVAGGTSNPYDPDVLIFRTGDETAIQSWNLQASGGYPFNWLSPHALAFSPDGSRLFAVASGQFFVLTNPDGADTPIWMTSAPASTTLATTASLAFSSPDSSVTFKCSLDGAIASACTSPVNYTALASGLHTFQVQAIKGGEIVGSTGRSWLIEAVDTTLSGGPSATTYATTASFSFSSHDTNATFQCSLDGADWSACTSPAAYTQLGIGAHTFSVRAVDGDVTDPNYATKAWTVKAPDSMFLSTPVDPTYSADATFKFWSHDGTATFQCSLDGADWSTCTSPTAFTGLALGSHTFAVRALNDMGAPDPVGATKTWTIIQVSDLTTQITHGPSSTTRSTNASFSFTSNDPTAGFLCTLDGSALSPCTSPASYSGLEGGSHTFAVYAYEGSAGDATGASRAWNVNLTSPPVASLSVPSPVATGANVAFDASASHDLFDGTIVDYKWDFGSGSFTLDTGSTPTTSTTFANPGPETVRVQVTNQVGVTAIASAVINVEPAPPPGIVGVSINNGDYATSSASVHLNVVWPLFAQNVLISNDGGFAATGGTKTVPVAATIPWTLASGGSERLPHIVYLRFPDSTTPTVTFFDDIILDTTTPAVSAASSAGKAAGQFKVKLVASEKRSGIAQAQFSTTKTAGTTVVLKSQKVPGITALNRTIAVKMAAKPKWARVRSTAGKWSAWHAIK
jgi:hypothetical protein